MFLQDFSRGMYIGSTILTALKNSRYDDVTELMTALCMPGIFCEVLGYIKLSDGSYKASLGADWLVQSGGSPSGGKTNVTVNPGIALSGSADSRVVNCPGGTVEVNDGDYVYVEITKVNYPNKWWSKGGNSLTAQGFDARGLCEAGMKVTIWYGTNDASSFVSKIVGVTSSTVTLENSIPAGVPASTNKVGVLHRMITPLEGTAVNAYGDYIPVLGKSSARGTEADRYYLAKVTFAEGGTVIEDLRTESMAFLKTLLSKEDQLAMAYLILSGVWKNPHPDPENGEPTEVDLRKVHEQNTDTGTSAVSFTINSLASVETKKLTIEPEYGTNGRIRFGDGLGGGTGNSFMFPAAGGTLQVENVAANISAVRSVQYSPATQVAGQISLNEMSNVFGATATEAVTSIVETELSGKIVSNLAVGTTIYLYAKDGPLVLKAPCIQNLPPEITEIELQAGEVIALTKTGMSGSSGIYATEASFIYRKVLEIITPKEDFIELCQDLYNQDTVKAKNPPNNAHYSDSTTFGRLQWLERVLFISALGVDISKTTTKFEPSTDACLLDRVIQLESDVVNLDSKISDVSEEVGDIKADIVQVPKYGVMHLWQGIAGSTGVIGTNFSNGQGNTGTAYEWFGVCNGNSYNNGSSNIPTPDLKGRMIIGLVDIGGSVYAESGADFAPGPDASVSFSSPKTTSGMSGIVNQANPYGGTWQFWLNTKQTPVHWHRHGPQYRGQWFERGNHYGTCCGGGDGRRYDDQSAIPNLNHLDNMIRNPWPLYSGGASQEMEETAIWWVTSRPIQESSTFNHKSTSVVNKDTIEPVKVMPPYCGMVPIMRFM